jgi:hypothetical protein
MRCSKLVPSSYSCKVRFKQLCPYTQQYSVYICSCNWPMIQVAIWFISNLFRFIIATGLWHKLQFDLFWLFYQSIVHTFTCIVIELIYKVVITLVVLLQLAHGTCGNSLHFEFFSLSKFNPHTRVLEMFFLHWAVILFSEAVTVMQIRLSRIKPG